MTADSAMRLLTISDVARMLGIKRRTVGEWFRSGQIAVLVLPGMKQKRTTLQAVQELIANKTAGVSRPFAGPIENSSSLQIVANGTRKNGAKKKLKNAKGEWRERFR